MDEFSDVLTADFAELLDLPGITFNGSNHDLIWTTAETEALQAQCLAHGTNEYARLLQSQ